jgi:beta-galactosidase/beta-glucuronidase
MKRFFYAALFILASPLLLTAQEGWKMVPGKITTPWAQKVKPATPLPEYPRPHLVRKDWTNLNGLWQYAILPKDQTTIPAMMDGSILVPFAVESTLSGVGKTVGKDSVLWYKKTIFASASGNKNVLLHFGAVDWQCTVYVNGQEADTHQGGYDPFSIDITKALRKAQSRILPSAFGTHQTMVRSQGVNRLKGQTVSGTHRSPVSGKQCGWKLFHAPTLHLHIKHPISIRTNCRSLPGFKTCSPAIFLGLLPWMVPTK